MDTHEVFNQTPPFVDINLTMNDGPLRSALAANGVDIDAEGLAARATAGRGSGAFSIGASQVDAWRPSSMLAVMRA